MEDGEIKRVYQYYEDFTRKELVDKILEIIMYQKVSLTD